MRKLLLACMIIPLCASSQTATFKRLRYDQGQTMPKVMVLQDQVRISQLECKSFLRDQLGLKTGEDFMVIKQFSDQLGMEHIRFQQTLNGVPIMGAEYTAHLKDGFVVKYTGHAFSGVASATAQLSSQQALQRSLEYLPAQQYMWEDAQEEALLKRIKHDPQATYFPHPQLMYFNTTLDVLNPSFTLAYEVDVYAKLPLRREKLYIDVQNGQLIQSISQLHDADQRALGVSMFSDTVEIMTRDTLSGYGLFDFTRGGGIETYDMHTQTNYSLALPFIHNDTVWDIANAEKDEAAIDAHWGAEMTYDYFLLKHGRDSYDNQGSVIISYVHFDYQWQNASWDGARMRYGDGGVQDDPFLSIDIAGHEMAHGVTQFASGLIYAGESGGLNESFSDIFGNSIEHYADSVRANWYMGEQCGNTLRNMADPNEFNNPDTYLGGYWVPTQSPNANNDWGGVHTNSGVQNFWYYLLVEGGIGVNDNGDSYNVQGMGWDAAGAIAYRNLEVYLTTTSGYMDARDFAYEATADIYGDCSPETENVMEAWFAVGVGMRLNASVEADFLVNYDYACELPLILDFTNLSVGATSYQWDFGSLGTSAVESPSKVFDDEGTYTIQLTSYLDNGCYMDTAVIVRTMNLLEAGAPTAAVCYSSVVFASDFVGIDRVELRTLDYESGLEDAEYMDYTCKSNTILHVDSTYQIHVTTNPSSRENVRVWIDMNDNGEFEDDELLYSNDDTYTHHIGTISFAGKTPLLKRPLRMRVMSDISFNKNFTSCAGLQNGQTEDYSVIITDDWNDVLDGVAANIASDVHLYPNPASTILNVGLDANERFEAIEIIDAQGRTVQRSTTQPVDISSVASGLYTVKVLSDKQQHIQKLIIR